MARNYSNIAFDTTLVAGIAAGDLSMVVASAAGWPAVPFAAVIDPGSLTVEEVVQVTNVAGTTFTITRGFDGTTAAAHSAAAVVRHSAIAGDFTDLQAADTSNASGLAAHAALTTTAHGGIVAGTDPRLTDARTPTAHASTHASIGSDPVALTQSQVTNLTTDLAAKVPTARTLTINGVTFDLSANRSWTTPAGTVTGVTASAPLASSGGATPNISLTGIVPSANGGTGVANAGTLTNASNTTITGGGTLGLGGFTLTAPATGTAALLATANVFTIPQTVQGSTNARQLIVKANSTQSLTNPLFQLQNSSGTALLSITSNDATNVYIGVGAGVSNSGTQNAAMGNGALGGASSGSGNFALGSSALANATTCDANVAIGTDAGRYGTSMSSNMLIGNEAGLQLSGNNNVMIGRYAGQLTTGTVSDNVIIGFLAGRNLATGNNANVIIGPSAGSQSGHQGSNQLIVENSNSLRPLIYGSFSADTLTFYATDAATAAVRTQTTRDYSSSGTPAAGFGSRDRVLLRSSTTDSQLAAATDTLWATATHASFKARVLHQVGDAGGLREYLRGEASGTAALIGLYGAAAVAQKAAITAPTGGATIDAEARTAIGLILTALGAAAGGIGITA